MALKALLNVQTIIIIKIVKFEIKANLLNN